MLGNPESISLIQLVSISVCGLAIVFLCLSCLILAIKLLGFIFKWVGGERTVLTRAAQTEIQMDENTFAVLICTVSEATGFPPGSFRIKSITSIDK